MFQKEEYQFIYRWFSNILGRELTDAQLQSLQAGEFTPFFAFLKEAGFAAEIAQLEMALASLQLHPHARLELAADFAECFLLEGAISAMPYASAYLASKELTSNLQKMDDYLTEFGLQTNRQVNEPSDHLCVYLEILLKLVEQKMLAGQRQFIREQLQTWLPKMTEKLAKIPLQNQFYPALFSLLCKILALHAAES
ncbi:molecular chaperone TorD [Haemophilus parahaemolyticus]|uniref:molecular chaperone TorD n=1 Tax=Haemophilus parahaemolyticus TaxID=735 RepID=UPI0028E4C95A|nr:molecular chaperone TorD [Haemophilus parahaemolyticus]